MAKMNIGNDEFHLRYYNQDDIPNVLQVLYESMQHRPIFHDIYQMKESVKKLNIHMSSQGNAINGWRVIFKGKKSKSVGTANERKKFPGAYGIGRETIKKRNWELGLGFMFSVGSMNGIGSINEPPDDNDSNAPNVTKVFFRDKMMENINVVVTIPRVDLLQQNLAQIEYEDDNPLKHMVILDEEDRCIKKGNNPQLPSKNKRPCQSVTNYETPTWKLIQNVIVGTQRNVQIVNAKAAHETTKLYSRRPGRWLKNWSSSLHASTTA
ncbi:hypothetical protein JHK85_048715 [Glycine max]|nr:hypothetical protein JHK86_048093 [Glycine max]KAG4944069.1 hypothetical protein JHK85_048715 [Glycine max]